MVDESCVSAAREEMDYRSVEGNFGQEMEVSIPCQLRLSGDGGQDVDRFHEALKSIGVSSLDPRESVTRSKQSGRRWYDGEFCFDDGYDRFSLRVVGSQVRFYPHDDYVPTETELHEIFEAIEEGFDGELEHNPIED